MDLQDESALETMAMLAPTSATVGPPVASSSATVRPPVASSPTPQRTLLTKGFPKEIAQNVVEDKFLCEYCHLIVRHPMQSRCGHRYCSSCRDELLSMQQPIRCQSCLTEGMSQDESIVNLAAMFDDKAAIREMKKIPVKCINAGCQWKGTFEDFSMTHELDCDKKLVDCSKCGAEVSQARLASHLTKQCPKRSVTCPHCKEEMFAEQREKHLQISCPNLPVQCHKCTKQIPRSEVKTHKDEECPHRIVECPVPDCNTKLPLDQFPNHFMKTPQSTQKHLLYLFSKTMQLEKTIAQLEAETAGIVGGASGGATDSSELNHPGGTSGDRDYQAAEAGESTLAAEDRQKLKLHEDLMAVLHGEILRCIKQLEALYTQFEREGRNVKDVQRKIDNLEKSIVTFQGKLQEIVDKQNVPDLRRPSAAFSQDPKDYGVLTESPDGTAIWRIDSFTQVRRAACNGSQPFISSPSFFTGPCGYKLRIRFYADGDGTAKGKAFSAFIQLHKGPHDDLLPWPFTGKVYFIIVDIKDFREHKVVSFSALPDQPAFQKPQGDNMASGCLEFVNLKEFSNGLDKYLANDAVYIKIYISLPETVNIRLQSLDPKIIINLGR